MDSGDSSAVVTCQNNLVSHDHGESIPKRPCPTKDVVIVSIKEDDDNDKDDKDDDATLYLDYNATTPMAPEVKAAIWEAMNVGWANPSSHYAYGLTAKKIVHEAREKVAGMLNAASPEDVIFTSGGTEADNWVIRSTLDHFHYHRALYLEKEKAEKGDSVSKPHVITTNFEHDAVRLPLEELQRRGHVEVSFLPPVSGQVSPEAVLAALQPNTCLISVMLANNEIGAVQPVAEIVKAVKNRGGHGQRIFFHTDAAQTIGKIPTDVQALDVDFLTLVGHKFYGPRIGALYVKNPKRFDSTNEKVGTPLSPLFYGGGQERAFRPGTENTPMIAGLGVACELVSLRLQQDSSHMKGLLKLLESQLDREFNKQEEIAVFNSKSLCQDGYEVSRLPNTCNVSLRPPKHSKKAVSGRELLSRSGIAASVGAACHGNATTVSSVLLAFGVDASDAATAIRISVGRGTTNQQILRVVSLLRDSYDHLYPPRR